MIKTKNLYAIWGFIILILSSSVVGALFEFDIPLYVSFPLIVFSIITFGFGCIMIMMFFDEV